MKFGNVMGCLVLVGAWVLAGCSAEAKPEEVAVSPGAMSLDRELSDRDQADLDASLAERAVLLNITNPPQIDRIRLVSQAETPQTQIDCLTAAGYPATLSDDGQGWQVEIPAGQAGAHGLAAYTCAAQYPTDPAQDDSRITEDQKKIAYTYVTETLVACLADHGHEITGIPAEETFLGTWDTGRWDPYDQVPEALSDLLRACPPNVPPALLWGS